MLSRAPRAAKNRAARKEVSYGDETLWREFKPAQADLIFNIAMAATLVWIPLTAAAVGRCSFVKYRVTDKRLTVITDAPWKSAPPHLLAGLLAFLLACPPRTIKLPHPAYSHVSPACTVYSDPVASPCTDGLDHTTQITPHTARMHAEDESQVGFHEVSTVTGVNRGFGLFGDMVIQLSGGDKLELRSVPKCAPLLVSVRHAPSPVSVRHDDFSFLKRISRQSRGRRLFLFVFLSSLGCPESGGGRASCVVMLALESACAKSKCCTFAVLLGVSTQPPMRLAHRAVIRAFSAVALLPLARTTQRTLAHLALHTISVCHIWRKAHVSRRVQVAGGAGLHHGTAQQRARQGPHRGGAPQRLSGHQGRVATRVACGTRLNGHLLCSRVPSPRREA